MSTTLIEPSNCPLRTRVIIRNERPIRGSQRWYRTSMKKRPTVYVICGFIGAGKTTFAKKLEAETGAVRITKDEWSISLIGNDPTIEGYAEWDSKIIELSRNVAFQLAQKEIDVIIDEGFWEKDQRAEMRRRIDAIGAKAILCYLDTPVDTIRERVVRRNEIPTKDSFQISRELLDHYLKSWEPLTEDEDYVLASDLLDALRLARRSPGNAVEAR
jgi:predicted kinase